MHDCATDDRELLCSYSESRSEGAFAELVRRHVDLVYSVALRVTTEPVMAQDICQEVFLRLARQSGSIRNGNALAAWLYRVTRSLALNDLRSEARRRHREKEAIRMTELETGSESVWHALNPLLEEGMGTLDQKEQAAVVLRFFADKSLREVGQALSLSEEAARKRVSRGLEKLRSFLAGRGVQVSSSALAALLAGGSVQSAPAGLAAGISAASVAAASTATSAGLFSTLLPCLIMSKTTLTIVAVVAVSASLTPLLLTKTSHRPPPAESAQDAPPSAAPAATLSQVAGRQSAGLGSEARKSVLERVATLAPLTTEQIGTYVAQNKTNAESLLAAYRASTDNSWLKEAAARFPNNPDVQYTIVSARAFPDSQREWIDAYKRAAPDNALAWYFSALEHFKSGDNALAIAELTEATRKPTFHSETAVTVQGVEELNLSAGRAADEAKIAAFQTCAQFPELPQMRELAKFMKQSAEERKQQGDSTSADAIASMGLVLGTHLSEGSASQTLINQLVGMSVQKLFIQQLPPDAHDPFGRPVGELAKTIERRQAALKDYSRMLTAMVSRLDDAEWAVYMERVKLYGEEAALTWLKTKHGE